jgi:hypothetical protein
MKLFTLLLVIALVPSFAAMNMTTLQNGQRKITIEPVPQGAGREPVPIDIVQFVSKGKPFHAGEDIAADDDWLKRLDITIKNISDKPIIHAKPMCPQTSAQKQPQQARQQVSDLLVKIYADGDLPKEWDNLSDREVELEIYKLTRPDGKPPTGWENWPKFLTPKRPPIMWFIEFTAKVKKKDFDKEIKGILDTYGGVLMYPANDPLHRGFWVRMLKAAQAEQISQEPQVRRVEGVPASYIRDSQSKQ